MYKEYYSTYLDVDCGNAFDRSLAGWQSGGADAWRWADSLDNCRNACGYDASCFGYTFAPAYSKSDASGNNCFLFQHPPKTCDSSAGSISGVWA